MKILLGTDILINYIYKNDIRDGINALLRWVKLLGGHCCTDISSIAILTNFTTLDSLEELNFLEVLKGIREKSNNIKKIEKKLNGLSTISTKSYKPLLALLNWLFYDDVNYFVTDNRETHYLAHLLQIDEKVFTIEEFIEKCGLEYRNLDDSKGVVINKVKFNTLRYDDPFFDVFKKDYLPYYKIWFEKKANDDVYVAKDSNGNLRGLLKLKIEDADENYHDIKPLFSPAKRLKICSLKAQYTSQKLGQRFMRIIFKKAITYNVDEIYITIVARSASRTRLIGMLSEWGFEFYGHKGIEQVYVRNFRHSIKETPSLCFPYHSSSNGVFILPIYRSYASALLPPITEDYISDDVEPIKQAIKKVVVLHEDEPSLQKGSILLFYQKTDQVEYRNIIAVGVVETVYRNFLNERQFRQRCHKRSLLQNSVLSDLWQRADKKPVVVEFLYVYSFKDTINEQKLIELGITSHDLHSQCVYKISQEKFNKIIKGTKYAQTFVVD